MLRGGALKPTTDGNWAHVVCALAVFEVSFVDVRERNLIDVSQLSPARQKLVSKGAIFVKQTTIFICCTLTVECLRHGPEIWQKC